MTYLARQAASRTMGRGMFPAAWPEFALLILPYRRARLIDRRAQPSRTKALSPGSGGIVGTTHRFYQRFLPLLGKFRLKGVDGRATKFISHAAVAIWNTCKSNARVMPFPYHLGQIKDGRNG